MNRKVEGGGHVFLTWKVSSVHKKLQLDQLYYFSGKYDAVIPDFQSKIC